MTTTTNGHHCQHQNEGRGARHADASRAPGIVYGTETTMPKRRFIRRLGLKNTQDNPTAHRWPRYHQKDHHFHHPTTAGNQGSDFLFIFNVIINLKYVMYMLVDVCAKH